MENVFLHLFNMSITAGWLVLAVVVLRLLLKKAPKWLTCLLWVLVAVRLVCPFSIESVLSLIPSAETVPPDTFFYETPVIDSGVPVVDSVINPVLSGSLAPTPMNSVNPTQVLTFIAALVWVAGMVAMAIYALVSTLRLRYKVRESVHLERNIRQCDHIATPFILGVFRPRIYLPSSLDGAAMVSVVAHEEAHLKRRDHWWKPLGFLLLTVYWFNPLLWVAYILLCRDIEAACDEKVVRDMDAHQRKAYSEALLSCSAPRRLVSACPLAFGETGVKARIKSVLHYKKPAFWIVIVAAVAVIVAAVCLLTNPKTEMPEDLDSYISQVILEQNKKETGDGIFACEAHEVFGTEEKGRTITVYALVYYHEYAYAEGELIERSGSCLPTAITVKKKGKAYQLLEYWVPGTEYAKDLQAKFPEAYHSQVLDFPAADLVALLKAKCLRQAEKNFGIEGKQYDTYCYNLAYMKLERDGNECLFCTSSLSSTFPYKGTYTLKERYLYLSVAGGTLTFRRDGDAFVFDRAGSTVTLEGMGASAIVDGVRFTPKIDRRTEYFEPLVTVSGMSHLPEDKRDALYKDVPSGNLPVLALTSPAEVDAFLAEYGEELNFDPEWDAPTPRERLEGLDDAFFADYSVLAVYYSAGSCSVTPQIVNLSYYKEQGRESILLAEVDVYEPQAGDMALGQWFMLAKVDKAAIKNADTVQAQVRQTIPEDYYFQAFTQPVRDLSKANPMSRWRLSDADQHQLQQMVDRLKWMDDALLDRNLQYDACFRLGDGVTYYLDWSGKVLYDGSRVAALTQEDINFFDLRLRLSGSASAVQAHVTGTMTGWNKAEDYLLLKVTQSDRDLGDTVKVYTRFYVGSVPSDGATVTVGYDGWPVEGDPMEVYAITMEMSGYADLEGGPPDPDRTFTGKVIKLSENGREALLECYDKEKFDTVWVYLPEGWTARIGDVYTITHTGSVDDSNPPRITPEHLSQLSTALTTTTSGTTASTTTTKSTTTTTTTAVTTTTTATTKPTTTPSPLSQPKAQFTLNCMGETILFTYEEDVRFFNVKSEERHSGLTIVSEEEKEPLEKDALRKLRYYGKMSDGTQVRCDVLPESGEVFCIGVGAGQKGQSGNDEQTVRAAILSSLRKMGYSYTETDMTVSVSSDGAGSYYAWVVAQNDTDGGVFIYAYPSGKYGWCIANMHLDVNNRFRKPNWTTDIDAPSQNEPNCKLIVLGKDITEGTKVFIHKDKGYAELPFTAILEELGATVDRNRSKTDFFIFYGSDEYKLVGLGCVLYLNSGLENWLQFPSGEYYSGFQGEVKGGEFMVNHRLTGLIFERFGVTCIVDYDTMTIEIKKI